MTPQSTSNGHRKRDVAPSFARYELRPVEDKPQRVLWHAWHWCGITAWMAYTIIMLVDIVRRVV